jgi:gluconate/galactonate dehydratase
MAAGGVDVLAPDIQKVGGLSETKLIAALGNVHSRPVAPHNIAGPVGTLASAHLCASIPNLLALEWHAASVPFFDELVTLDQPVIQDGYVTLPDGPGIGAELDLDVARRYARPGELFFGELPA